jgi:hypothetical protein
MDGVRLRRCAAYPTYKTTLRSDDHVCIYKTTQRSDAHVIIRSCHRPEQLRPSTVGKGHTKADQSENS